MRFEFATATRIDFGAGTLREVGPLARELGSAVLVVTGSDLRRAEPLLALLREHGLISITLPVRGEPTIKTVRAGVKLAERISCDLVISIGGGSALDAGKAIAAMMDNGGELLDYLEVIGGGKALANPPRPVHRHPDKPQAPAPRSRERRARLAGAPRQSEPAQPVHAAEDRVLQHRVRRRHRHRLPGVQRRGGRVDERDVRHASGDIPMPTERGSLRQRRVLYRQLDELPG